MKSVRRLWKPFVASVLVTCLTVTAAPAASASAPAKGSNAVAVNCPPIGQRLKVAQFADIWLVGPEHHYYRIPDPTVYFSLWDSWSGIVEYADGYEIFNYCPATSCDLEYAHLAKDPVAPATWIYDHCYGYYRWIINGEVFNKYAFSWSKIRIHGYGIYPTGSDSWY